MQQRTLSTGPLKVITVLLCLSIFVLSCSDKKKTDEDLKRAFQLHKEAIKVRQTVQNLITQLNSNQDSVFLAENATSINAIDLSLAEWDEQLIEVPGFEEEHHHHDHADHDHDHDHGHQPELTSKQHLEVQQQLLDNIKMIAGKIRALQ